MLEGDDTPDLGVTLSAAGVVIDVAADSAASRSGLQLQDVVAEIDGEVLYEDALFKPLWEKGASQRLRVLRVWRLTSASCGAATEGGRAGWSRGLMKFALRLGASGAGFLLGGENKVLGLQEGSVAAAVGLRVNDVIVMVDGVTVSEAASALKLWDAGAAKIVREVGVVRRGAPPLSLPRAVLQMKILINVSQSPKAGLTFGEHNKVEAVDDGSPADCAGLRVGDRVIAVDGVGVTTSLSAAQLWNAHSVRNTRTLSVERATESAASVDELQRGVEVVGACVEIAIPRRFGIPAGFILGDDDSVVEVDVGSAAYNAGLRRADLVIAVDGVPTNPRGQIASVLWDEGESRPAKSRTLIVRRGVDGRARSIELNLEPTGLTHAGFKMTRDGTVLSVDPQSAADKAGLQVGDMISAVDGVPTSNRALNVWDKSAETNTGERRLTVLRVESGGLLRTKQQQRRQSRATVGYVELKLQRKGARSCSSAQSRSSSCLTHTRSSKHTVRSVWRHSLHSSCFWVSMSQKLTWMKSESLW